MIRLEGREHLERALAAGQGAILWVAPFVFASLVTKVALHRAGFALGHLSRREHGYSASRFGARFLNPVCTSVEARYLSERVVIGADRSVKAAMQQLTQHLQRSRPVSITVGAEAARTLSVPFLEGRIVVATGPPRLSLRTGAPLLPVFTLRQDGGEFVTVIERPLEPASTAACDDAVGALVTGLARQLETYVTRWPGQFLWCSSIMPS